MGCITLPQSRIILPLLFLNSDIWKRKKIWQGKKWTNENCCKVSQVLHVIFHFDQIWIFGNFRQSETSFKQRCLDVFFVFSTCQLSKGQIKPKADWQVVDSPKKRRNEFGLFAFLFFTANKTNFGRIYGGPKLLSVLSTFRKRRNFTKFTFYLKFFLKLHCPKNERNIRQNSALWSCNVK